ncbi:hypothetical protein MMC19_003897 [Ptychographa xylographoides]|nr:hypothetical protein [Ptychographa xylographoides]
MPENSKVSGETRPTNSYLAAPSNVYGGHNRNTGSIPIDQQFALLRGDIQEVPIDRKMQALERARERTSQSRSRAESLGPPVIVNTRTVDDIGEVPLSERHPLERGEFIRGTKIKNEPYHPDGVHRPEDESNPFEDQRLDRTRDEAELDGGLRGRRQPPDMGELEAQVVPRIVRVQTDGWPESG